MSESLIVINSYGQFSRVSRETYAALVGTDNTEIPGVGDEAVTRQGVRVANEAELKVYRERLAKQAERNKAHERARLKNKIQVNVVEYDGEGRSMRETPAPATEPVAEEPKPAPKRRTRKKSEPSEGAE